jgi:hypothetical protein
MYLDHGANFIPAVKPVLELNTFIFLDGSWSVVNATVRPNVLSNFSFETLHDEQDQ